MAAETRRYRPVAGTIGLVFGGLWSMLGAGGLPHDLRAPAGALGALVTVALIARLWLRPPTGGARLVLFRRAGYIVAVALEIAAIYAASTLLSRYGMQAYVIPAVGVIVGLHFIGLWQATRLSSFLWIAGGMCAVSALAAALPEAWQALGPRALLAGFGNALVLWIGAGRPPRPSA